MSLHELFKNRMGMVMIAFSLVFFTAACGNDQPEVADESAVVVDGETDVAADADVAVDADAEADADVAIDEVDAVATEVTTDTETIVDTDVITQTEVITQVEAAKIEVETTVLTDTDVTVDRATDTESEVTVETEDVVESDTTAIIVLADSAGGTFLGDPVGQRPFFVSEQEGIVIDENFEPVHTSGNIIYDEGLNQDMFGESDQEGVTVLTFNDMTLYRYTGPDGEDWRTLASELGLRQVTPEGQIGDMTE